jgi:hypothetical protein
MVFLKQKAWYVVNKLLKYCFTLSILTISNEKNSKLESCKSHGGQQFLYKNLHMWSYEATLPATAILIPLMLHAKLLKITKMSSFRSRACSQTMPRPSRHAACTNLQRDREGPDGFQFLERHVSNRDTPIGTKSLGGHQFSFA